MSSQTKQIIIIVVYVLIFSALVLAVYFLFLKPAPTCSDGKQNQGEEGIDCGGPCPSCEIKTLKNIKILWVKALHTSDQNYDLVAQIQNPNQNYGLRNFGYRFGLYDLNGRPVAATTTGASFILPRGEKYLMKLKVPVTGDVAKIVLELDKNLQWERIKDYLPPEVDVFDKKYEVLKSGTVFSQASANVKNSSHTDYTDVGVAVVVLDGGSEPIAVNSTSFSSLASGQERYFSVPWYFEIVGEAAILDVEPEVNMYEQANVQVVR